MSYGYWMPWWFLLLMAPVIIAYLGLWLIVAALVVFVRLVIRAVLWITSGFADASAYLSRKRN